MAKFSEIISGIVKDLVQVQMSGDIASMEVLSHYKNNEILKSLDIPRFTLGDINMKLKFAIAEQIEPEQTDTSVKYAETQWLNVINKDVIAGVIASDLRLTVIEKRNLQAIFDKVSLSRTIPDLDMKTALEGSTASKTVQESTKYILGVYEALPADVKKRLPDETAFKTIVDEKVANAFADRMPALKKAAAAKASLERDMEIIVEKAALENINTEQIHEISLNLTPDFIKFVQDEEV